MIVHCSLLAIMHLTTRQYTVTRKMKRRRQTTIVNISRKLVA